MSPVATLASDLDAYRAGVDHYLASPGPAADEAYAPLFEAEAVASLEAAAAASANPRRIRALGRFAAEGHLRRAGADDLAVARRLLGEPIVTGPHGAVSPQEVDLLLAGEPDRERRADLQRARLRALGSHLAGPLADAAGRRGEAARALGAPSSRALIARVADIDLDATAAAGRRVLDGSADVWMRVLDGAAHEALALTGATLTAADLPRLVRAPHREGDLPQGGAPAALAATSDLLGLSTRIGSAASELAGVAGYAQTMRAGGEALAREGASARLPVEARRLGDPALHRAHGIFFAGLIGEPVWLVRVLGLPDPSGVARAARAVGLLALRAAAARALPDAEDALPEAVGVAWPDELRLADPLAALGPADELRGRMLAAALRAHLRDAFGERWFAEPRAGALLGELWLEGGDLEPAALAVELGAAGLDPSLLVAEAAEAIAEG